MNAKTLEIMHQIKEESARRKIIDEGKAVWVAFASAALQGHMASLDIKFVSSDFFQKDQISAWAAKIADAMLVEYQDRYLEGRGE